MAVFYREDIVDIELESGSLHRSFLTRNIGKADNLQDRFGVRLFRNGQPVAIGGSSCIGLFMAPNGQNILISGSTYTNVSGNVAWVQLPQACYNYEGQFALAIKLTTSQAAGTIRIIDGVVNNTGSDDPVAPTETVPTYQEILSLYEEMLEAKAGSVRYDIAQSLTSAQKLQARVNIDAVGKDMMSVFSNNAAESCMVANGDADFPDPNYYDITGQSHDGGGTLESTELIPCYGYHAIGYYLQTYKTTALTIAAVAFYDENKTFISAFDPYYISAQQQDTKGWCPIPDNAYYFRASTRVGAASQVTMYKNIVPVDLTPYKTNEQTIYEYDGSTFTSTSIMFTTYYIPTCGFKSVKFYGAGFHGVGADQQLHALETVTFFNASLQRISGVMSAVSNNNARNQSGIAPIPEGTKWLKLFYRTDMTNPPPSLSFINTEKDMVNIVCIGDSITEGWTSGSTMSDNPYPGVMQEKLPINYSVFNAGVGGLNAATYWTGYKQYLNLSQANAVIIMLGLNGGMTDTFDTDVDPYSDYDDYAETITGYTCKWIEWLQEQCPKAMIIVATPTYASKTTANETQAENQIANIPGLVERYNIPVINIRDMMGINEKNYTTWLSADKVHGNNDFYLKLADAMTSGFLSIKNVP